MDRRVQIACYMIVFLIVVQCYNQFENIDGVEKQKSPNDLPPPLILTPYLKNGKVYEAQNASLVNFNEFKNIKSHSGYFTVDENYLSNLFFWFFPARNNYAKAPVVLWLQGGPGMTSMLGLFMENGPFIIENEHGLKLRDISWIENHSVIYMDTPVGTGLSFTEEGGHVKSQTAIGNHLYSAILQFFQLFPELQSNAFFISGESYGGKYVTSLGYAIYKNNNDAKQKINLQGITIGNGFFDPEHQMDFSEYLYQIGLVDINQRVKYKELNDQVIKYVREQNWDSATELGNSIMGHDFPNLFRNDTTFENAYNFLNENVYFRLDSLYNYIQRSDIRNALHVGNTKFEKEAKAVKLNLKQDFMQSVAPWLCELLDHYRILFYNGQLDIRVAYPVTLNVLQNLKFSAANQYKTAVRKPWYVNSHLAGYVKQAGNLYEVLVRNAGHLVPMDQPEWALDLITKFTYNKPFSSHRVGNPN